MSLNPQVNNDNGTDSFQLQSPPSTFSNVPHSDSDSTVDIDPPRSYRPVAVKLPPVETSMRPKTLGVLKTVSKSLPFLPYVWSWILSGGELDDLTCIVCLDRGVQVLADIFNH